MKEITWGIRLTTADKYGNGHIKRSLLIANEIIGKVIFFTDPNRSIKNKENVEENSHTSIKFAYSFLKEKKIDGLIIDNYNIDKKLLEEISNNFIVIILDDFHSEWKYPYVVRPCLKTSFTDNKLFQGSDYILVSRAYYNNKSRFQSMIKKINTVNILLNMGANDSKNNNFRILQQLISFKKKINKITLVLKKNAPHYKKILLLKRHFKSFNVIFFSNEKEFINEYFKHNYFIGTAGLSSLERISLSAYALTFSVSSNQYINGEDIKLKKFGYYGGDINKISNMGIKLHLDKYLFTQKRNCKVLKTKFIDGNGAKRISKIIDNLIT